MRTNHKFFINREISKVIMTIKSLQVLKCVLLLQKAKKYYFTSLDEKHTTENKCFWKIINPFLSNKVQSSKKIKFAKEDSTLLTNEVDVAMKLNNFFWNAVINLKIPKFENFDPLSENINHPTLKTVVEYRKLASIIEIASEFTKKCFFNTFTVEDARNKVC